jgi:hypothetical protein
MSARSILPHLPLDILNIISHVSISAHRALLAIPRFARSSLIPRMQENYQTHHLTHVFNDRNGAECWYLNQELHRIDGPAVIDYDGRQFWYLHGRQHRVNGPADISPNGNEFWLHRGHVHRDPSPDGSQPAITIFKNNKISSQSWWLYGQLHRTDGPALIYYNNDGDMSVQVWFQYGQRHRDDGPGRIDLDGFKEYWLHGHEVTPRQFYYHVPAALDMSRRVYNDPLRYHEY